MPVCLGSQNNRTVPHDLLDFGDGEPFVHKDKPAAMA